MASSAQKPLFDKTLKHWNLEVGKEEKIYPTKSQTLLNTDPVYYTTLGTIDIFFWKCLPLGNLPATDLFF